MKTYQSLETWWDRNELENEMKEVSKDIQSLRVMRWDSALEWLGSVKRDIWMETKLEK